LVFRIILDGSTRRGQPVPSRAFPAETAEKSGVVANWWQDNLAMVVRLNIPDETLLALKLSGDAAEHEVLLVLAVKLYEMGRLSGGAAAQLAGLPKPVFMTKLADYGVPVFKLSEAEIARDAQNA
jgi:predicted HTH domain antitoxin